MNTKQTFPLIAAIAIFIFTGYSCNHEQRTTTKINSDGSCERTVFVKNGNDTSSSFPVPNDKSWHSRIEEDSLKEGVFIAGKMFDNVNQMNNEYRKKGNVGIDINFEKKFRWFYTYFFYEEIYRAYFPFKKISLESFLTKEEYTQFEKEDTNKALRNRLEEFEMRNIFEEFYGQLLDSVKSLHDPSLPVSVFLAKKDEFINRGIDSSKYDKDDIEYQEKILGLKLRGKLERQIDGIKKSLIPKLEFVRGVDGNYINEVIMPGIILNTNANIIDGSKVSWKLDGKKFCYHDYSMSVESRIANPWATYATGGVLLVIVGLLLLPRSKRK
jgi:hypothetical protein